MTIENYRIATDLLKAIELQKDTLVRVRKGLMIRAEGEIVDKYLDRAELEKGIEEYINRDIIKFQAEFDSL